jgi:hypothetical protein
MLRGRFTSAAGLVDPVGAGIPQRWLAVFYLLPEIHWFSVENRSLAQSVSRLSNKIIVAQ